MPHTIKILLIEDDQDDIELLQETLRENGIDYELELIKDGGQVAGYLGNVREAPDVIVMDFNLPKIHGREILRDIRSATGFQHVPIVILSTSSATEDINYSYNQGASRYLIKPTTLAGIRNVVDVIVSLANEAGNENIVE
ncbi:response regulator [Sediminibacterium ginsengisoli]|uniref:Response regulator receiver domain-containing protein n=1 Tax=Sediminibacterium ginsengisoli TaxID=413434 RepID=A0A1T4KXG1_9BACT|nr:response regulator [Sediminibacterium ginsengisoli]SJZ47033.1 Response regulator receiver domain-containing protein [Sediminibacterium ginsengisoli]